MNVENILSQFAISGTLIDCISYGEGHINSTQLVTMQEENDIARYILQRIHPTAFGNIHHLMDNINAVTDFITDKIREKGKDPTRGTMHIIPTKSGESFFSDGKYNYRIATFVENSVVFQSVEEDWQFAECGYAFGKFARLLEMFDAASLYETIPHFHDTERRYANLLCAIENNKSGRAGLVEKEIAFAKSNAPLASYLVSKLKTGELPTKVTHNDTKLNNVLFDKDTKKSLAVIDLDTVMAGSICFDFGDAIRYGCNTAAEDETDLSRVHFSLHLFRVFTEGYLRGLGSHVTPAEIDSLAMSALVLTYECGMRFLTDYLDGDVYFRVAHPNHNLDRCRTQFTLLKDMQAHLDEMKQIVKECTKVK